MTQGWLLSCCMQRGSPLFTLSRLLCVFRDFLERNKGSRFHTREDSLKARPHSPGLSTDLTRLQSKLREIRRLLLFALQASPCVWRAGVRRTWVQSMFRRCCYRLYTSVDWPRWEERHWQGVHCGRRRRCCNGGDDSAWNTGYWVDEMCAC